MWKYDHHDPWNGLVLHQDLPLSKVVLEPDLGLFYPSTKFAEVVFYIED